VRFCAGMATLAGLACKMPPVPNVMIRNAKTRKIDLVTVHFLHLGTV
jgi:hypothetical protein